MRLGQPLLLVFVCCLMLARPANADPASRYYDTLDRSAKVALQRHLIWTDRYPGPMDGQIGPSTIAAIKRLQIELGEQPTGRLSVSAVKRLVAESSRRKAQFGFVDHLDTRTGTKIGLPRALVKEVGPTLRGNRFAAPDGRVEIEVFSIPVSEMPLQLLYQRLRDEITGRSSSYAPYRDSWFVVRGDDHQGTSAARAFYVRVHSNGIELRGFSISYRPDLGELLRPVVAVMSFDFDAFPSTTRPQPAPAPQVGGPYVPLPPADRLAKSKMQFAYNARMRRIFAVGEIQLSTAREFDDFVQSRGLAQSSDVVVTLLSPGGKLFGGMQLGRRIRSHGFATATARPRVTMANEIALEPGDCESACAYAFLGGTNRIVREQDRLGIHRFYGSSSAEVAQITFGTLIGYVTEMGVDARLLQAASEVAPEETRYLTRSEMVAWRVIGQSQANAPSNSIAHDPSREIGYPHDLQNTNPAAVKALHQIIPPRLRSVPWIYDLNGVAGPLKTVTVAGKPYIGGLVCKPHDCGDNKFAFLAASDGSRAVAALKSQELSAGELQTFGAPAIHDTLFLTQELQ